MRLIDADALIKELEAMANNEWNVQVGSSKGLEDAIDVIDNAPTVEVRDNFDIGYVQGLEDGKKRAQDFTRKELVSWLWTIAINNTENELGRSCKEIIHRLDGFERYVSDIREEAAGGNHD